MTKENNKIGKILQLLYENEPGLKLRIGKNVTTTLVNILDYMVKAK